MSSIKTNQFDGDASVGRNLWAGGNAEVSGSAHIGHNLKVDGWLEAKNIKGVNKGLFVTPQQLRMAYPNPSDGWLAAVGVSTPFETWIGYGGEWKRASKMVDGEEVLGSIEMTVDNQKVDNLVTDVENIHSQVSQHGNAISRHNIDINSLQHEVGDMQQTVESLADDVSDIQGWQGGVDIDIAELENHVSAAEDRINKLESEYLIDAVVTSLDAALDSIQEGQIVLCNGEIYVKEGGDFVGYEPYANPLRLDEGYFMKPGVLYVNGNTGIAYYSDGVNVHRLTDYADFAELEQTVAEQSEVIDNLEEDLTDVVGAVTSLERDLAQYEEEAPLTLTANERDKAIDNAGQVTQRNGYCMSMPTTLKKGNIYLYRSADGQPIAQGVALCSKVTKERTTVLIEYTYTYEVIVGAGKRIATAVPDYDPSMVYSYTYPDGSLDNPTITLGETEVVALPATREVERGAYVPLFRSLSTAMPKGGYYAVVANEDCEAVWSIPVNSLNGMLPLNIGEVKVVSYGFVRSLVNQKADRVAVEKLTEQVADNTAKTEMIDNASFYAMADIAKALHPTEAGVFALVAPHGVAGDVTNNLTREQWMWIPRFNYDEKPGILDVALVQGFNSLLGYFSDRAHNLRRINTSGWDWEHINNLRYAFKNTKVVNIDTADWAFHPCLNEIYGMCQGCSELSAIDASHLNFENTGVSELTSMFSGCTSLKNLDVSGWFVRNITHFSSLFHKCSVLEALDVSGWDMSNAGLCYGMFYGCTSLKNLDVSGWTLENISTMRHMFINCESIEYLDFSSFVGAPTEFEQVFSNCTKLRWLKLPQMDTGRLTAITSAFGNCPALRHIELGPKFFKTTLTLPFRDAANIGVAEDGSDNGWLAHLVAVTPTIRAKAGYGDDEDIPLLEEEGGVWYLNDGTARTLQLPSALKNKAWAPSLISQLQAKGYTIA